MKRSLSFPAYALIPMLSLSYYIREKTLTLYIYRVHPAGIFKAILCYMAALVIVDGSDIVRKCIITYIFIIS